MSAALFGYEFRDPALLRTASAGDGPEFQRLEFLGDAVLDAVLLPWIYQWSTGSVAVVAGARQQLAADATLSHLALIAGLDEVLPPERRDGPYRADMVEAVVGAAFRDGGWEAAAAVCETVFRPWLEAPLGPVDGAARIDTHLERVNDDDQRWRWTATLWQAGSRRPRVERGMAPTELDAELDALIAMLRELTDEVHRAESRRRDDRDDRDRDRRAIDSVWIEVGDELLLLLDDPRDTPDAPDTTERVRTLRGLLAPFAGVWLVPADRIDTTAGPWQSDAESDGVLSAFEITLGHDLVRAELERLALHPGDEQRRLAFVGNAILKAAAAIHGFERSPRSNEGQLSKMRDDAVALARLNRGAFELGLVDLLFPGARPVDPVTVVRAALGALAVDAGPAAAVHLATQWLERIRVAEADVDHLILVDCRLEGRGDETRTVVRLVTPAQVATWEYRPDKHRRYGIVLEGVATALDSIGRSEEHLPILLRVPSQIAGALEGSGSILQHDDVRAATDAVLARIHRRGLTVLRDDPEHGLGRVR